MLTRAAAQTERVKHKEFKSRQTHQKTPHCISVVLLLGKFIHLINSGKKKLMSGLKHFVGEIR